MAPATASAGPSPPRFLLLPLLLCALAFRPEGASSFSVGRSRRGRVRPTPPTSPSLLLPPTRRSRGVEPRPRDAGVGDVYALPAKKKGDDDGDVVALIHSHHLLDHKPDNMILTGKKFQPRGVASLGRPGVALCVGSRNNVDKFTGKLRGAMPQKKFAVVEINCDENEGPSLSASAAAVLDEEVEGFGRASLGELRELLAAVGREDRFLALVGVESPANVGQSQKSPNNSVDEIGNSSGSSRGKGAGRKKRRKRG